MKFFKSGLILSFTALFIFACADNQPANSNAANAVVVNADTNAAATPQATATVNETADGRAIYTQSCANCHKEDGTGGKKEIEGKIINVDNLTTDKMKKMADEKYVGYIKNGVPDEGMPAFKDRLSDEQINEVVKYIRTELQKQ